MYVCVCVCVCVSCAGWKLNPVVGAVYGPEFYAGKELHSSEKEMHWRTLQNPYLYCSFFISNSLTEKCEMSTPCKHCISRWYARNVLKLHAHQHDMCHAHFTYLQCKAHMGEDDSIVARG